MAKFFSVKLYKTRDQYEICTTTFENVLFNGVLVYVCISEAASMTTACTRWRLNVTHSWRTAAPGQVNLPGQLEAHRKLRFGRLQTGRPLTYNSQDNIDVTDCLDIDHLLRYEWNFTGGAGHSLLWLEATTFLNYMDIYLNDHLLKYGRNVAGGGGNSLLWPEASVCLNYLGAYSRPEVDIVVYGPRLHCFI